MTICLPLRFEECNELSPEESQAVKTLVDTCTQADGFDPCFNFDTNLNLDTGLPPWRLAWAEPAAGMRTCGEPEPGGRALGICGILAGAASIFAPTSTEAELSACVAPVFRRQGIFQALYTGMVDPLRSSGYARIMLVSEGASPLGAGIATRFGAPLDHSEYLMHLPEERIMKPGIFSGVRLVPVTADLVGAMVGMFVATFGDSESDARSFIEKMLADPARELFMARNADGPVGTVALSRDGEMYMLHGLGVLPALRRRGYGGDILDAAITVLDGRKAKGIRLEVESRNHAARLLYLSRGFIDAGRVDYWMVPPTAPR